MGCGCKNKANTQTPQQQAQTKAEKAQYVQETVKDAIKKTVEKYYKR